MIACYFPNINYIRSEQSKNANIMKGYIEFHQTRNLWNVYTGWHMTIELSKLGKDGKKMWKILLVQYFSCCEMFIKEVTRISPLTSCHTWYSFPFQEYNVITQYRSGPNTRSWECTKKEFLHSLGFWRSIFSGYCFAEHYDTTQWTSMYKCKRGQGDIPYSGKSHYPLRKRLTTKWTSPDRLFWMEVAFRLCTVWGPITAVEYINCNYLKGSKHTALLLKSKTFS